MSNFVSPYKLITDKILADLEAGVASWVKPWKSGGSSVATSGMPYNFTSKTGYRGINVFMLYIACVNRGWQTPAFATFNQIKGKKGQVKKGEKGEHVFFMSKVEFEPKGEEGEKINENGKVERFILKGYTVFNIDQIEGIEIEKSEAPKADVELPADVADLCEVAGVKLNHGGDKAFYRPSADAITLPLPAQFESVSHYKATGFHEVGHATGAEHRLNREFGKRFGDEAYAFEELVAELTAAFLCLEFGVEGNLRHPEYIASWIKVLKGDERAFYKAAAEAQKAVDWLREQAGAVPAEMEREAA